MTKDEKNRLQEYQKNYQAKKKNVQYKNEWKDSKF